MKPTIKRSALTVFMVSALILGSSSAGFAVETDETISPATSETTASAADTATEDSSAAETTSAEDAGTGEEAAETIDSAVSSAPDSPVVAVTEAYANWDFRRSFREYVGFENETRNEGLTLLDKGNHLLWKPKAGQTINANQPTGKLAFTGQAAWLKYGGVLNVKISNPTIDFDNKTLLVDGYTAGTMARAGEVQFQQQAIATLADLKVDKHDGYLVISSLNPVFTDKVKELVGLYTGEKAAPFVVTLATTAPTEDKPLPLPVLWEVFPDTFKNPSNGPIYTDAPLINVEIPDAGLNECIREQYEVAQGVPITNKVLEGMQALNCAAYNIGSLRGLEHAVNLTSVNFNSNNLFSLTPLRNSTKLVSVSVNTNKLTSLAGLENASQLVSLKAKNNQLNDVSAVKSLGHINSIDLTNNRISDLSQLAVTLLDETEDKIDTLNLSNNRISDLSAINTLPIIRKLDLSHNQITQIGELANKPGLLKLNLEHNFITDPSPLGAWANQPERRAFEQLKIRYNSFTDWSSLEPLKTAEDLDGGHVNKVYNFPESGDEQRVVNPKTLEEIRSKQAEADAAFAPEFKAYRDAEEAARLAEEAKKNFTATLSWGVKETFRNYVSGDFAHGKWTVADGVTGTFDFPLLADSQVKPSTHDVMNFGGKIHFTAHEKMLDLTIANLKVKKVDGNWKLYGDVLSRPFDKSQVPAYMAARNNPNAPKPVLADLVEATDVEIANLSNLRENEANGAKVLYFGKVALTAAGNKAFANFYKDGELMDVLTVTIREGQATGVLSTLEAPAESSNTSTPVALPLTAQMSWGVKSSFRSYIKGGVANGDWSLSGGVYGEFNFPSAPGAYVTKDASSYDFTGTVRFTGHDGLLDLSISSPRVEKVGNDWQLVATVTSLPLDPNTPGLPSGFSFRSASGSPTTVRTAIANLSEPVISDSGDITTLLFTRVTLTAAGADAFANFYKPGQDLDSLAVNIAPEGTFIGADLTDLDNANNPANANQPAPAFAAQANANGKVKQCKVDPTQQRITGGTLAWGVRASFNNYIRGSIAHGGWDLAGISWDGNNFNWPATGGLYNTATRTGTIYYGGSVHYHGHGGILDLTLANPALQINGNSGALYLSVNGSDMQGKKFSLGRVHFANVSFGGVSVVNGQLQLSNAAVTLTDAGAKAFVGFYKAGEPLAPLGSTVNLVNATACDPATGELVTYGAFGNVLPKTGATSQGLLLLSLAALTGGFAGIVSRRKLK